MRATRYHLPLLLGVWLMAGADWPQFRGSDGTGFSPEQDLPTHFSDQENVAWKAPLPGSGPSSPIVVAGRVLVTAASGPRQQRLHVLAFDVRTGKRLWERQLWATGHTQCNPFGGVASPTPASDGQRVFAFWSSNDLACFDLDGNLQWLRGLAHERPLTRNDSGMASSPLVAGDVVVVQMENQGTSWAAGIDAVTGETRWRIDRPREATWTSPALLRGKTPAEDLVLIQSKPLVSAHDPRTGKEVWRREVGSSTISSATAAGERIYVPCAGLTALRCGAAGQGPAVLWEDARLAPANVSPVVHEGRVYVVKSPGVLVCADAAKGEKIWELRVGGRIWATPALADGHLYVVNYDGLVQVVRDGARGTLAGKGQIDAGVLASPAVADGAVFFRSHGHLWKIARTGKR